MNSPCHGCEERSPGCHDRCGRFKQFREELDALNHRRKLDAEYHHMKKDMVSQTMERIRKHRDRRS